jgi:hypothetical protein
LDFAQKKDKSTLEKCLSSQTYKVFKNQYNTKLNRDAELGNYCKQVINTDHLGLKTIHKEKKRVRHGKADQLWVLKVVKL